MKSNIQKHIIDKVISTEISDKTDVMTFWRTVTSIISDFYNALKNDDSNTENLWIIETSAKLLLSWCESWWQPAEKHIIYKWSHIFHQWVIIKPFFKLHRGGFVNSGLVCSCTTALPQGFLLILSVSLDFGVSMIVVQSVILHILLTSQQVISFSTWLIVSIII